MTPPDSGPWKGASRSWLFVVLLLGAQVILGYTSAWNKSPVYDEPAHLFAGYTYLTTGDFRLTPDHPPLAELLAAAPLLFCHLNMPDLETPGSLTSRAWNRGAQFHLGRQWLYASANDPERIMRLARAPMLLLTALGGLVTYLVVRRSLGITGGLIALILWAFSPTILAHGRWVTTDLPLAVFFLPATYSFWKLTGHISAGRLVVTALWVSALFVTKFSAGLFLPVAVLLVVLRVALPRDLSVSLGPWLRTSLGARRRGRRAACITAACLPLAMVVVPAIWACFGFRYRGPRQDGFHYLVYGVDPFDALPDDPWHWLAVDARGRPTPTHRAILYAAEHRLLPEPYLYGALYTLKSAERRLGYLRGQIATEGRWYYFPYAFAVKTSLPLLVLFPIGLAGWVAYARSRDQEYRDAVEQTLWPAIMFLAVYGTVSLASSLNIGHRHLLPIYPFVFVMASGSAWFLRRQGHLAAKLLVTLLLILHAATALRIRPHYLSHFNLLAGGPANGWRHLSDSNIDWGQDLIHLQRYLEAHPELLPEGQRLKLAYFGTADPEHYLGAIDYLPSWPFMPEEHTAELEPGLYALSVTQLTELYLPERGPWSAAHQERLEALAAARRDMSQSIGDAGALAAAVRRHRDCLAGLFPPETRAMFLDDPDRFARFFDALPAEVDRAITDLRFCQLVIHLRKREPLARIGYSIYLHRISAADLREGPKEVH